MIVSAVNNVKFGTRIKPSFVQVPKRLVQRTHTTKVTNNINPSKPTLSNKLVKTIDKLISVVCGD